MKISEVEFKCVLPNLDTANQIAKLAGLLPVTTDYTFLIVKDQAKPENEDIRASWTDMPEPFTEANQPYLTPDEAIKLLESCEENQKSTASGEWVEFDIDKDGEFSIGSHEYKWQNYVAAEMTEGRIFGGWLFEKQSEYTQDRYGEYSTGNQGTVVQAWVRPLTPIKIRFWKPKSA